MPPAAHARLSPSASERWLSCPASVRVVAAIEAERGPEPDSPYAAEGTLAHELAEIEASLAFGKITTRQRNIRYKKWLAKVEASPLEIDVPAMRQHVADYISFISDRMDAYPHSIVMFEQRLDTGVPTCWGTSDTVISSPVHVEIIDLKYGTGVPVSAIENPQLRLYGLGALDSFGDVLGETRIVITTVFQPRLNSVSSEELTADELRAWRDSILPVAAEAIDGSDRFGPSESACRWCPAAGECRARIEYMTQEDFGREPDLIGDEEMGELLARLPDIRNWVTAVEAAALDKAFSRGERIPGWKVVMSGGIRKVYDSDAASETLLRLGLAEVDVFKTALRGIGELESAIRRHPEFDNKARLEDVLGELVGKTPGRPSLVPESDKRPAASPDSQAAAEFKNEE